MHIRHILLMGCLLCMSIVSRAQESLARQQYLQAEAAYQQKEYAKAVGLLRSAQSSLGGNANPRIAYLRSLSYEKLAMQDIGFLDSAVAVMQGYVAGRAQYPPIQQAKADEVTALLGKLPDAAKQAHTVRVKEAARDERLAFKAKVRRFRMGYIYGMPSTGWHSTSSLTLGTKSTIIELGTSNTAPQNYEKEIYDELKTQPPGSAVKYARGILGVYQSVRVLPRRADYIRPFVGVRGVYQTAVRLEYDGVSQAQLDMLLKNGFDPVDHYNAKLPSESGFSFDACAGLLLQYKGISLMAGMDFINSKTTLLGFNFSF